MENSDPEFPAKTFSEKPLMLIIGSVPVTSIPNHGSAVRCAERLFRITALSFDVRQSFSESRLCRWMCGKALPFRLHFLYFMRLCLIGGGASNPIYSLYGKAKPFRTSAGKALPILQVTLFLASGKVIFIFR
ncbi:MAG: hypothetical protein LUM44_17430 [Pyrinomonadaceae bacterium]|nr:hypothetical protein [Pyrinomonadaceae bacterium]